MNEAIKIHNLTKSYGTHIVLNGLDFCVQQGEIFALLGVNGAGKTTALECIEGLRKYDSGSIIINGIRHLLIKKHLTFSVFMNLLKNSITNYRQGKSGDSI